jgi:DNA-binding transcriptional LysR family regulator
MENDMSDVLRDMALAGHGIAWLPDSTVMAGASGLVALDGDMWTLPIKVVAFRDRTNKRRSVARLWSLLANRPQGGRPRASLRNALKPRPPDLAERALSSMKPGEQ